MKAINLSGLTGILLCGALVAGCSNSRSGHRTPAVAHVVPVAEGEVKAVGLSMFAARSDHQVTSVGADLAVITGGVSRDGLPVDTAEAVDVRTGQRFAFPDRMNQKRRGHVALLLPSGDVLVAGGRDETGADLDTCEIWSPASGAFSTIALRLSVPRYAAAGIVVGDIVIIAGGEGQDSADVLSAQSLTLQGTITSLPGGDRVHGQVVPLDGTNQVLVYGGANQPAVIDLDTLTARALRGPVALGGTALVANLDGSIKTYVVGGALSGRPIGGAQVVDEGDTAIFAAPRVSPSDEPTAVGGDGFIYTAGGLMGGNVNDRIEIVAPSGTRLTTPLLRARTRIVGAALPGGVGILSGGVDGNGNVVAAMEILTRVDFAVNPAFQQAIMTRADFERRLDELALVNKQAAAVRAQVAQIMSQIAAVQTQIADEQAKNAVLQNELNKAQAEVARLTADRDRLQKDIRDLQDQIRTLQGQIATNQAAIRTAQSNLTTVQGQLTTTNGQLTTAQNQASSLSGQISTTQGTVTNLRNQQTSLQNQLAATQSSLSVTLTASARVLIVGGSFQSTVSFSWRSTNSKAKVAIQVKSVATFRNWTTILSGQPASDVGTWSARGQPGETLNFRAVSTVGTASANSNIVTLK